MLSLELRKAADSTGPERAVARVINQSTKLLTYQALTDEAIAAAARGPQALIDHIQWDPIIEKLGDTVDPLSKAVGTAVIAEAGKIEAKLAFNTVDALSQKYAQEQAGKLISNITETQRATIREILGTAIGGDLTKDAAARRIRQTIGLHPAWAQAVQNFQARQLATVPKGYSPARWQATVQKRTDAYYNRLLRRRADNIARTELITAQNLGRYGTWADSIGRGLNGADSRKEWSPGPGACRICQRHAGETVRWDQPFMGGLMMPPAHPSCRCTAVLLPAPYENPALKPRTIDWLNPLGDRQLIDLDPFEDGFKLLDNVPTTTAPQAARTRTTNGTPKSVNTELNQIYKEAITPEQEDALKWYRNEYKNADNINTPLRTGTTMDAEAQRNYDQIKSLFDETPKLQNEFKTYRGLSRTPDDWTDNMTGRTVIDDGLMSTTRYEAGALPHSSGVPNGIHMKITVKPNTTKAIPVEHVLGQRTRWGGNPMVEGELILQPGTKLHILKDFVDKYGTRTINAEIRRDDDSIDTPAVQVADDVRPSTTNLPEARVKPTEADNLTYDSTLHWSDDKLMQMMVRYADDDPEAMDKILDIIDLRAAAEAERAAREARLIAGYQEQQKLDAELKAYVRDVDPATNPAVKPERHLNARQVNEEEYQQYVGSQINRALDDLNGVFFNNQNLSLARSKGITEESLFTGPYHVAQKYASEELKEWWLQNGRETLGSFRYRVFQRPTDKVHADRVKNLGHASGQARTTREYGL